MSAGVDPVLAARLAVLGFGFSAAAVLDLRSREVDDRLWQLLGVVGVVLGGVALGPGGSGPVLLWLAVGAFALEHLFPWDDALGSRGERYATAIEAGVYVGAILLIGTAVSRWGLGPSAVPLGVVALLATVVLARGLFELGVLYGGADAKAVIVAGVLVPLLSRPLVPAGPSSGLLLGVLPFAITLLTNAALFSMAVPIALALRNLRRGEFRFPGGFTGYSLPVALLPRRFVWVRDPAVGEDGLKDDVESSAEDTARRTRLSAELVARGVRRVWVSPQIPFVVLLAAGAFAGVLFGNLLLDAFSLA